VIGEAKVIGSPPVGYGNKTQIVKTQGIRAADIVLRFLHTQKVFEPKSYFTQICYESSAFLPFYYLLKQAGIPLPKAVDIINSEHSTMATKAKLLKRIDDDSGLKVPMPCSAIASGQRKLKIRDALLKKEPALANSDGQAIKDACAMVRTLEKREMPVTYLKDLLEKLFNKHYARGDQDINHELRRAICYLDFALNRSDVETLGKSTPETRAGK
jgi:hypothetical protein